MRLFPRLPMLCLLAALPCTVGAQATTPLVVIRFNQAQVRYEQQLYGAVAKAVAAKPDVMFDVVSYAPQTGQASADSQWQAHATQDTQSVVASMQQMGVPLSRMHVLGQTQPGLHYDETHIYVR